MGTYWITATEVTFDNQFVLLIDQGATERTGSYTGHTLYAFLLVQVHRPVFGIASYRINETGFGTGCILTLKTGYGYPEFRQAGFDRINRTSARLAVHAVCKRAGQFTSPAASAEIRYYHKA